MMRRLLIAVSFFVLATGFFAIRAEAAAVTLSGYAWSENVGWIHFKGANYGVTVDSITGAFAGDAWSENIGWLSFVPADGAACGGAPSLNISSGAVTGWAKVLATGKCVHLAGANYGVTYSNATSQFSGYAWEDTDIGWIHFAGAGYAVVTDVPVIPSPGSPSNMTATAISTSQINLAWHDNSSNEANFILERKTGAGGTYAQIATPAANATSFSNTNLSPSTSYYYRIKATNSGGDSSYSNEDNATTNALHSTINVTNSQQTASWTINPGGVNGVGNDTADVIPAVAGTAYSITPAVLAGYEGATCTWNNGSGSNPGCSGMTLFGGESSASFTVSYVQSFNYSLSNNGNISIEKGGGSYLGPGSVLVTEALVAGTSQLVNLSVAQTDDTPLPPGIGYQPVSCTPQATPTCNSTINFTVDSTVQTKTYHLRVTGQPLGKTTDFDLTVTPAKTVSVTCTANPSSALVGQNVTWTATPSGGTGPYTVTSWTTAPNAISPAPTDFSFTTTYSTTGSKTALVHVLDSRSVEGSCTTGSINIGVNPSFQEF